MNKISVRKLFSILLALFMVIGVFPLAARATTLTISAPDDWDTYTSSGVIELNNGDTLTISEGAGSPDTAVKIAIKGDAAAINGSGSNIDNLYIEEDTGISPVVTINNLQITAPSGKDTYRQFKGTIKLVGTNALTGAVGYNAISGGGAAITIDSDSGGSLNAKGGAAALNSAPLKVKGDAQVTLEAGPSTVAAMSTSYTVESGAALIMKGANRGIYSSSDLNIQNDGAMTVSGASSHGIHVKNNLSYSGMGTMTVNGSGTGNGIFMEGSTLTVSGGTIEASGGATGKAMVIDGESANIMVGSGTLEMTNNAPTSEIHTFTMETSGAQWAVSGTGVTHTGAITDNSIEVTIPTKAVGTVKCEAAAANVCEIDGTGYASLNLALADVEDEETITLLQNIDHDTGDDPGIVIDNITVIFNLNNKILDVTTDKAVGIEVKNGGKLELSGDTGELNVTSTYDAIRAEGTGSAVVVHNATSTANLAAYALDGGKITVLNNAVGKSGVCAGKNTDTVVSQVEVLGNVTATDDNNNGVGVEVVGGGRVTVDGDVIATGKGGKGVRASSVLKTDPKPASKVVVNGNVNAGQIGVDASDSALVTVEKNVTAGQSNTAWAYGVWAQTGGFIEVKGNVSANNQTASTGAYARGTREGSITKIAIDGMISGTTYIKLNGTPKTEAQKDNPSADPNYHTYTLTDTNGIHTVWVKDSAAPPTGNPAWTKRASLPASSNIDDMKYLNDTYWAVGYNSTLLKSTDGTNWTKVDVGSNFDRLSGIDYGGGTYVLVGSSGDYSGRIYVSADGTNWTEKAAVPQQLSDVAFGQGKFVVVGGEKNVLISTDNGNTWQSKALAQESGKKTKLLSIACNSLTGRFVAVGMGSDSAQHEGGILTSADGETWTLKHSEPKGTNTIWDVTYGNGTFVAVGGKNSGGYFLATSGFGDTWVKPVPSPSDAELYSVEFDGSRFIASGRTNYSNKTAFTTISSNGATWTDAMPGGIPGFSAAASDKTTLTVVDSYGSIYSTTPVNGTTWTYRNNGTTRTLNDVAYNGSNLYVAVGEAGTIQTSSDGRTWAIQTSGTSENLNKVEYLNNRFIAVGQKGTILTSSNGTAWTKQASPTTYELKGIAYGNGKYVAVGGNSSSPVVLYSGDAAAWTNVTSDIGMKPFNTVAYGDNIFMALTDAGWPWTSPDGATWTMATDLGSGAYPVDLIYAGNKFAAASSSGRIYLSSDKGASWTLVKDELGRSNRGLAYADGNFIAVGELGNIIASADSGATWYIQPSGLELNPHSLSEYTHLNGITAGDNCFLAVGAKGLVLQSDTNAVSVNSDAHNVAVAKAAVGVNKIMHGDDNAGRITRSMNLVAELSAPTDVSIGSGALDVAISWHSSKPQYIATDGTVTRPAFADGNQVVYLTATFTEGSAIATKQFIVVVLAHENSDLSDVHAAAAALTFDTIKGSNTAENNIIANLTLPDIGANETGISWTSYNSAIDAVTGEITRPAAGSPDQEGTLVATITKGTARTTKTFTLRVKAESGPATPAATATASAATLAPVAAIDNVITLTVKDSLGGTDTSFTGEYNVTIAGVEGVNDSYYGFFDGTGIGAGGTLTKAVTFTAGVAMPNLKLVKATQQNISFSIDGVTIPQTNTLTITPVPGPRAFMTLTQDVKAPTANGGRFSQQPILKFTDASGNLCTNDSSTQVTVTKYDIGNWTLTGATTVTALNGIVTFTDLGATNEERVTGARLKFTSNPPVGDYVSTEITLPAPAPPSSGGKTTISGAVTPNTADFDKNPDNAGYKDVVVTLNSGSYSLSGILLDGKALVKNTDYTVNGSTVTFKKTYLATLAEGKHQITFDMSGGVDPNLTIRIIDQKSPDTDVHIPFEDVKADDWFADNVIWAYEAGLMEGTGATVFNPQGTATRGMIVTILYRLENSPAIEGENPFSDIEADKYYADAVIWAAGNKIVDGYGNGSFGPESTITREQMAVILMNYAKYKGYDVSARADLANYSDADSISNWALDAMSWANAMDLIQGVGTKLMPGGNAERCQVAAILQRFVENIGVFF